MRCRSGAGCCSGRCRRVRPPGVFGTPTGGSEHWGFGTPPDWARLGALATAPSAPCPLPGLLCRGPLLDYDCVKKCMKGHGWKPVSAQTQPAAYIPCSPAAEQCRRYWIPRRRALRVHPGAPGPPAPSLAILPVPFTCSPGVGSSRNACTRRITAAISDVSLPLFLALWHAQLHACIEPSSF